MGKSPRELMDARSDGFIVSTIFCLFCSKFLSASNFDLTRNSDFKVLESAFWKSSKLLALRNKGSVSLCPLFVSALDYHIYLLLWTLVVSISFVSPTSARAKTSGKGRSAKEVIFDSCAGVFVSTRARLLETRFWSASISCCVTTFKPGRDRGNLPKLRERLGSRWLESDLFQRIMTFRDIAAYTYRRDITFSTCLLPTVNET